MAVTSLSDLAAGLAVGQRFLVTKSAQAASEAAAVAQSFLDRGGSPGAATLATTLGGSNFTAASAGAVPLVDPSPALLYLAGLTATVSTPGELTIHDLLWQNGGISATTTTAQTVNSAAFPARDNAGATSGAGVELWLAVFTANATNASPITNTTASYTNSAGTSGRTATIASVPATLTAGSMVKFQLQGDDVGVRSVQSLTLGTSYGAGTLALLAMRRIADVPIAVAATPYQWSWGDLGLPQVFAGSYLHFGFVPTGAVAAALTALWLTFAQK